MRFQGSKKHIRGVHDAARVFQGVSGGVLEGLRGRSRNFRGYHEISGRFKEAPGSLRSVSVGFQVASGTFLRGFKGTSRESRRRFTGFFVAGGLKGV